MEPKQVTIDPFVAGDTWKGIPSLTVKVNGSQPSSSLTLARMRFTQADRVPSAVVELSSTNSKITITDAAAWKISIPPQIITGMTAGLWKWNLEMTSAAGKVITYIAGILTVHDDV